VVGVANRRITNERNRKATSERNFGMNEVFAVGIVVGGSFGFIVGLIVGGLMWK